MVNQKQPWEAELRIDLELARQVIGSQFPELLPLQIQYRGEGWGNVILQVNGEYLFRFPRRKIAVELFPNKAKILPKIRHRLPLCVPELVFQGQPDSHFPFLMDSNKKFTGIIDWGDVHFGDPAVDLQIVFTVLPSHAYSLEHRVLVNLNTKRFAIYV